MESNKPVIPETQEMHQETMQAEIGYDKQEPQVLLIGGFGIATAICLAAVVLGIQAYFDHVKNQEIYDLQLRPVSEDYRELRTAEEAALNSYKYADKDRVIVRIPVSRAMELLTKEASENKLQYFSKEYPVKGASPETASVAGSGSGTNSDGGNSAPTAPK